MIVESPAKVRTIEKFLGKGFEIAASMGHIRGLPVWKLGVDTENGFEPEYEILKGKKKIAQSLAKSIKSAVASKSITWGATLFKFSSAISIQLFSPVSGFSFLYK